jgi:hypothetical protein
MAPKYVNVDDVISAKKKFSSQLNDLHSDVISPSYVHYTHQILYIHQQESQKKVIYKELKTIEHTQVTEVGM